MNHRQTIKDYLETYAVPEARVSYPLSKRYDHVLVVPAHDEAPSLLQGFEVAFREVGGTALLIVVVNAAVDSPEPVLCRTQALVAQLLLKSSNIRRLSSQPAAYELGIRGLDILLIDRASADSLLEAKQGVGLARRIGCDVALRLMLDGTVNSEFIGSSDADVELPCDYFQRIARATPGSSALIFPYTHSMLMSEPRAPQASEILEATLLFECSLRYLVLGLSAAGSPYAFHTIGSTLGLSAKAYAEARGFPKRLAGEDFHLLNKLAKLAPVLRLGGTPISIQSRLSQRTPFGTGPSVTDLLRQSADHPAQKLQPRACYHPDAFSALKSWHQALHTFAADPQNFRSHLDLDDSLPAELKAHAQLLFSDEALQFGLRTAIQQRKTPEQRLQHLFGWFDALATQRLLRQLNASCPAIGWREALSQAPFIEAHSDALSVNHVLDHLIAQEGQLPPRIGPTCLNKMG